MEMDDNKCVKELNKLIILLILMEKVYGSCFCFFFYTYLLLLALKQNAIHYKNNMNFSDMNKNKEPFHA